MLSYISDGPSAFAALLGHVRDSKQAKEPLVSSTFLSNLRRSLRAVRICGTSALEYPRIDKPRITSTRAEVSQATIDISQL